MVRARGRKGFSGDGAGPMISKAKREPFGLGLLPLGVKIIAGKYFDLSGEILIQALFAKASRYTNHMDN